MWKTISRRNIACPNEKKEVVKELKKLAQKAEEIFLATDPDREGESISWHLMEVGGDRAGARQACCLP